MQMRSGRKLLQCHLVAGRTTAARAQFECSATSVSPAQLSAYAAPADQPSANDPPPPANHRPPTVIIGRFRRPLFSTLLASPFAIHRPFPFFNLISVSPSLTLFTYSPLIFFLLPRYRIMRKTK